MITASGISMHYGRTLALDAVDLELASGVTGLFGPNGSGKSTLLRVLCGLARPSRGSVVVDGMNVGRLPEAARRQIGYVGHRSGLYERLTVRENMELFARLYDLPSSSASTAIERLDLGERASSRCSELSAGWKRRAAVARATLHEPRFLFLDEPYANLDDDAARVVSDVVAAWNQPDRIAVVASHGAKKVKAYARAGVILQHGRIVRHGSYVPEEAPA